MAEAFLAQVKEEGDFAAAAEEIAETEDHVYSSSFTFGEDDTYPDEVIISATRDLEDDTLVEEIVETEDSYYVLYVDDAFDEEATADRKDEIVNERRQDAVNALYEEWMEAAEITVNEEVYGQMVFDLELMIETESVTEAETGTEEAAETAAEADSESETDTEEAAEAAAEAESETDTEEAAEAAAEAETDTEEAAEAAAEAESEAETEEATEAVTE